MADVELPAIDASAAAEFVSRNFGLPSVMAFRAGRCLNPSLPTTDAARAFIAAHPGDDLYFAIAERRDAVVGKPAKADCIGARWAWVDLDPPKGLTDPGALEGWRADQIAALEASDLPRPPVLINSGRGLWALWRLTRRVDPDEAEAINRALAAALGADHCHNIDRVARVPFTRNSKTGALATVLRDEPDAIAPEVLPHAAPSGARGAGATAPPPTIGARLASLDELDRWAVPDRVRVVLNHGRDPDNPKDGDDSRSAWLFDAVCQLVRCEVPDSIIMAILTDPDLGISASVLDKRGGAERYAARQIERARDHVADPQLAEVNERHFVVENDSGKCRVAEWVPADNGREQLSFQSFDDFRNRYMNRQVEVGTDAKGVPITKPLGGWWLGHARRRQFRGLVFRPGGEPVIGGRLNLWRGFGVDPVPGDWSLMRAHIRDVLAAGDPVCDDYILRWAAWAVQHPDEPAEVALVFRGGMGVGKSTFGRAMRRLFGQHGLHVNSPTQVSGRFNAHLRDVCLLFADEAIQPGDRAARGVLKAMLTEPTLPIEGKGRDVIEAPNYTKVVMASNEDWVAAVDDDDRRFAVFDVSKERQKDEAYFAALYAELDDGGLEAMLHDLLAMDLEGWHPRRAIPDTTARQEQRAATLDGFDAFFLDLLREGEIPAMSMVGDDRPRISTMVMRDLAAERCRRGDISLNQVSKLFERLGFEKHRKSRPSGFILPPLPEARAAWDRVRSPVAWDDADRWVVMGGRGDEWVPF